MQLPRIATDAFARAVIEGKLHAVSDLWFRVGATPSVPAAGQS